MLNTKMVCVCVCLLNSQPNSDNFLVRFRNQMNIYIKSIIITPKTEKKTAREQKKTRYFHFCRQFCFHIETKAVIPKSFFFIRLMQRIFEWEWEWVWVKKMVRFSFIWYIIASLSVRCIQLNDEIEYSWLQSFQYDVVWGDAYHFRHCDPPSNNVDKFYECKIIILYFCYCFFVFVRKWNCTNKLQNIFVLLGFCCCYSFICWLIFVS